MSEKLIVGQKVTHLSKNKVGKILAVIGGEENRYYVQHSGQVWSVPRKYLKIAPNKIK